MNSIKSKSTAHVKYAIRAEFETCTQTFRRTKSVLYLKFRVLSITTLHVVYVQFFFYHIRKYITSKITRCLGHILLCLKKLNSMCFSRSHLKKIIAAKYIKF